MDKHAEGMWRVDNRWGYFTIGDLDKKVFPYIINMPYPPFALGRVGAVVTIDPRNPNGAKANANLIVAAVNACKKVNESNPLAPANQIEAAFKTLEFVHSQIRAWCDFRPELLPYTQLADEEIDAILSASKQEA